MKPADQWWTINGQSIVEALQRAHDGETPDLVYLELFASSATQEKRPTRRTNSLLDQQRSGRMATQRSNTMARSSNSRTYRQWRVGEDGAAMTGFDAVRLVFAAWLVITVTMIVAANRWNRLLDEVRLERDVWKMKYRLGVPNGDE